jgi:DNA segregation ATPase FtsK/SpoIIIE-like protein
METKNSKALQEMQNEQNRLYSTFTTSSNKSLIVKNNKKIKFEEH